MKGPSKSQVDFYVNLCSQLIACDPLDATSSKDIQKDIETLVFRCSFEGLSFLSKVLPRLGRALDVGLITSRFTIPGEFKRAHWNRSIPAFMQAYFSLVFDDCGYLLDSADPFAVQHLRQVLFFAYKLEVPFSPDEESQVIERFVQTEEELQFELGGEQLLDLEVAAHLTHAIFKDFDPKDVIPRHGPGAVATGEKLDDKWEFSRLYNNIHQSYPYYDYYIVGWGSELMDRLEWYKSLERLEEGTAKVVLVPKDSRGPRLISSEPLEYQWIQQGLGRKIMSHLESHKRTSGNVNFTHQIVNQRLALSSSLTGEFSTMDMSDASDRVSLQLVRLIFKKNKSLLKCLEACRSTATALPDGRVISLKKFAPMGSALCFPVEAFLFWVIMVAAVSRRYKIRQPLVGKRIFIYGDDIIIPTEWVPLCIQVLESFALKVNVSKTCSTGFFRESCGIDAYKGIVVTPFRLRKLWSGRPSDGSAYASYVALANMLKPRYKCASDFLWSELEKVYGVIPRGTRFSSFPCQVVDDPEEAELYNSNFFRSRTSRKLQRKEFYLPILSSRKIESKLDSWPRLLRNMVSQPYDDPSTIVIPRSMTIKRRWSAVF